MLLSAAGGDCTLWDIVYIVSYRRRVSSVRCNIHNCFLQGGACSVGYSMGLSTAQGEWHVKVKANCGSCSSSSSLAYFWREMLASPCLTYHASNTVCLICCLHVCFQAKDVSKVSYMQPRLCNLPTARIKSPLTIAR